MTQRRILARPRPSVSGRGRRLALAVAMPVVVVAASCGVRSALPTDTPPPPASGGTSGSASASAPGEAVAGAGQVRYTGPTHIDGSPAAYWTFDDGPDPGGTDLVLDALKDEGAPATFFVLGQFMQTADEQEVIKRTLADGNALGAHGFTHPDMGKWTERQDLAEIRRIRERIASLTGLRPTCFRPPYGSTSPAVESAAGKEQVIVQLWDIDTEDWANPNAASIAERILSNLKPGAVILMHDGRKHGPVTAEVVRRVAPAARERGYKFGQLCPMRSAT